MPDEQQQESLADPEDAAADETKQPEDLTAGADADDDLDDEKDAAKPAGAGSSSGPMFSAYGWVATLLGLAAVGAVVFGVITYSAHQSDKREREYKSRVLQTAASWTSGLINLNAENVEKGMQRLHDKTVGQLNGEFEAAIQPYREVVQRIQSRSTGRIEAVAIESLQQNADGSPESTEQEQAPGAGRTDPVMVIATSIAENVGGKPQTVHWALRLDVTDVDGRLLISRLGPIR